MWPGRCCSGSPPWMSYPGSDPVPGFHHLVLPSQGHDVAPVLESGSLSSPSRGFWLNIAGVSWSDDAGP